MVQILEAAPFRSTGNSFDDQLQPTSNSL